MISKVAVVSCHSYDKDEVERAVRRGLEYFGGAGAVVKPNEKILLKPNMLAASSPEKAVTTHPMILRAVGVVLREAGAVLSYGDSPGIGSPLRTAVACGLAEAADDLKIPLADFVTPVKISFPQGRLLRQLTLAAGVLAADGIVNLPKMKTHALTRVTGAVKNLFGCVPGFRKGEFHVKMPEIERFCQVLVDIHRFLGPRFHIMDGIEAMSGNGPRGGEPFPMRVLLFSNDPLALDAVFCRLIDIEPEWVPTMKIGLQSGLGTYRRDEIEILGDEVERLVRRDFPIRREAAGRSAALACLPVGLKNWLSPRPVIDAVLCRRCGDCIRMCPLTEKALGWPKEGGEGIPKYDYRRCIRCYCCQEICPAKAIQVKVTLLRRGLQFLLDR